MGTYYQETLAAGCSLFCSIGCYTTLFLNSPLPYHMWQSLVEIEHYSVTYFDRVTTFEAL